MIRLTNVQPMMEVGLNTPTKGDSKTRSFSDPPSALPALAPSPTLREKRGSKDDRSVPTTPKPLRRPELLAKGLALQMPSPAQIYQSVPLSPRLDRHDIYVQSQNLAASPATSLPRHSRGLDFARACTTLHHSTVAEQRSPNASPVITQKGLAIPSRKNSMSGMMLDCSSINGVGFSGWNAQNQHERSTVSSSVGSVNMMATDSDDDSSDDDASMGGDLLDDETIYTTPQVRKLYNPQADTPFQAPQTPGGSNMWGFGSVFSPAQSSLMNTIRRNRLNRQNRKMRKRSSSASGIGYSSMASPRTTSPPPMRSIETAANIGYFNWSTANRSRRQSLAMGNDTVNQSSGNDSGDEPSSATAGAPGVVRRAVTRRGNLLPKTKGFARIRAALAEEAAPVDTEVRREAETIRQVRERDNSGVDVDLHPERPGTSVGAGTAASSPNLLPAVPECAQEDFGRELDCDTAPTGKGLGMDFGAHAHRNSGGINYWNRFDMNLRTPPPPNFMRQNSSAASDVNMDSPATMNNEFWRRPRARSSASDASEALGVSLSGSVMQSSNVMNDDMHLKKFKRRREEDFDIATVKRRAVSPGLSSQNSPVLTQSPSQRDSGGSWVLGGDKRREPPSASSDGSPLVSAARLTHQTSSSSAGGLIVQGKKLGLQGMVDTNDGLMKMSIE